MTRQTAREIEAEASRWLMRIDREGRTPALTAELDAWLSRDTRRQGAMLQAESAWALLDRLGEADGKTDPGSESAVWTAADEERSPWFTRRRLLVGSAAAIAASFAGGFFLLSRPDVYATAVGEIRRVPLADGSTAAINTRTEIAVALAEERRTVRIEEGEAWFQVARDSQRPFLVEAGRVRVMAVGTAFSVRRRADGADVLVTEGAVEAWVEGAEGHRVRLAAGERAFVADNAAISKGHASPSDVDRTLAWRSGRIDLAGETLRHAADEFNRYNRRQIVIADPGLADERLFGIFRTDDPEGFAMAVRHSLEAPVQVRAEEIRIGRPAS